MRRLTALLKYFWAAPTTALGILIAVLTVLTAGKAEVRAGILEAHGGFAAWFLRHVTGLSLPGGAAALTLGHVVIGCDESSLHRTRAHERVHVQQCERWGPLFIPAYLLFSAIPWVQGRDVYRDNRFEREAFARENRVVGRLRRMPQSH